MLRLPEELAIEILRASRPTGPVTIWHGCKFNFIFTKSRRNHCLSSEQVYGGRLRDTNRELTRPAIQDRTRRGRSDGRYPVLALRPNVSHASENSQPDGGILTGRRLRRSLRQPCARRTIWSTRLCKYDDGSAHLRRFSLTCLPALGDESGRTIEHED